MKKLMMLMVTVAMAMGVMAEITNTVKVTKFHQSYPYSGKATVECTVGGALPANAVAEITINTDDASATFTNKNIVTGANTFTIDFASSFGGALLLTNASFVVTIAEAGHGGTGGDLGGVQLWENGPYWAECNVGATKPEDYGYYFWWGDTVGYTRSGGTWDDYSYSGVTWVSSTGQQMRNSPFSSSSCPTYGKDNPTLQSEGYIDSTGNLMASHDAATAHLGTLWRMPTDAEFSALIDKCTTTWITTNGVSGRLVTGKGAYAERSIFLPAAGGGSGSRLGYSGSDGEYWSSTPDSNYSDRASFLYFFSGDFTRGLGSRCGGKSVRPVRDDGGTANTYTVTYKPGAYVIGAQQYDTESYGVVLTLKGATFTRSGYTQTGWATSDGGSKVYDLGATYTSNEAITLYPYWTAVTYTVTYRPGANGSGSQQTATKTHGAALTLKGATFTRSGYTQTGWATSDGGSKAYELGATYTSNEAITLYPYWEANWVANPDGVQLWENGPYWAECNVGASKPEEYGYYFWWGDTVGYTNAGIEWISVKDGTSLPLFTDWGTAASTYGKDNSTLQSAGWIDATGNLVVAHDAATAHLGAPWRMPTSEEIDALVSNCTTTWITTNGVNGRLVTSKGDYANKSIFLPAAGYGYSEYLFGRYQNGYYWSSTPRSDCSSIAWYLYFGSGDFRRSGNYACYEGLSVRPVRGFAP